MSEQVNEGLGITRSNIRKKVLAALGVHSDVLMRKELEDFLIDLYQKHGAEVVESEGREGVDKLVESLEKLTGRKVMLQEGQFNSLTHLRRCFKARDFTPTGQDFAIGKTKYKWSSSVPDTIRAVDLLKSQRDPIKLIYICDKDENKLVFIWKTVDNMLVPNKVVVQRDQQQQND